MQFFSLEDYGPTYHDSSCVDHWVMRLSLCVEYGGIEDNSAGLHPYPLMNIISDQTMDVSISDYLSNRLNREFSSSMSDLEELAIS